MKKLILLLFLVVWLLPVSIQAAPGVGLILAGPVSGCSYSGCSSGCKLFDWDCSVTAMGSNVCSLSDTSATLVGEASLAGSKVTITDGSANGSDHYDFTITVNELFPVGDFTLEITINLVSFSNASRIFSVSYDGGNFFNVQVKTTGDIELIHKGAGGTSRIKLFDTNLSTGVEYVLIIKMSTTLGSAIKVNAGGYTTDATADINDEFNDTGGTLYVGNIQAISLVGTIDNVRVSDGWRTDI